MHSRIYLRQKDQKGENAENILIDSGIVFVISDEYTKGIKIGRIITFSYFLDNYY